MVLLNWRAFNFNKRHMSDVKTSSKVSSVMIVRFKDAAIAFGTAMLCIAKALSADGIFLYDVA